MPKIELITSIVREHLREIHSVTEIAEFLGCSPETIRKDFVRKSGIHLWAFVRSEKVNAAKELLLETRMACRQVCFMVGFDREEVGERAFKNVTGLTMKQYRRQFAQEDTAHRKHRKSAVFVNRNRQ